MSNTLLFLVLIHLVPFLLRDVVKLVGFHFSSATQKPCDEIRRLDISAVPIAGAFSNSLLRYLSAHILIIIEAVLVGRAVVFHFNASAFHLISVGVNRVSLCVIIIIGIIRAGV